MKKLWITEKPSVAKELASVLKAKKTGGFYSNGTDYVVACYGHMLELPSPDEMNEKWKKWDYESLPVFPSSWGLKIKNDSGVKSAMKTIKQLLSEVDQVVNVGDPDREGQLLVDEVIEYYNCKKPAYRLWISDLNQLGTEIHKLKPNSDYHGFKIAAESRQRADFIVGMTFTRALSLKMKEFGYSGVFSMGRVQTPVLRLIVDRHMEIINFKPVKFYDLDGFFDKNGIKAKLETPLHFAKYVNEEGKILDKECLNTLANKIKNKEASVSKYKKAPKIENQPLLFNLGKLQSLANKKFSFSAQKTLDIAQKLYENKYTTYPRTDCEYAPISNYDQSKQVLNMLGNYYPEAKKTDLKIKSPAWNDKKVTAHYAIIPTGRNVSDLSGDDKKIYDLIAIQYIAQFYPRHEYDQVDLEFIYSDEDHKYIFKTIGKKIMNIGWKSLFTKNLEDDTDSEIDLPFYKIGDKVKIMDAKINEKTTTPPKYYTEGTLLETMANIHNVLEKTLKNSNMSKEEIDKNVKEAKQIFKDAEARGTKPGIGTEATRANIIETLKNRGYIEMKKTTILPTQKGIQLILAINSTPQSTEQLQFLSSPLTTAKYEKYLGEMVLNGKGQDEFFSQLKKDVQNASKIENMAFKIDKIERKIEDEKVIKPKKGEIACPKCGKGILVKRTSPKGSFWGCNKFPLCKTTYPDENGKPKL